jgi:hypothetical protein
MRKLVFLLVTTLALGATAPAHATETFNVRLKGGTAYAEWYSRSDTTSKSGYIEVSDRYDELYFSVCTNNYTPAGDFVGGTCTYGSTSDFTFTMDEKGLTYATVSATDVRARTCTYDADFNETCSRTRVDLDVTWKGRGDISRSGYNDRSNGDGYVYVDHFVGTSRKASATGTIAGVTFTKDDSTYARIGYARSGYTEICLGSGC